MHFKSDYAAAFLVPIHFDDFDEKERSGTSNELDRQEKMANREQNANDSDLFGVNHHFDTSGILHFSSFVGSSGR
jgi:hypothetical protein